MVNKKEEPQQLQNEQLKEMLQEKSEALDLLKREAAIEVALEKVRTRAMAMQKSDELKELIGTVFTELTKLDFVLTRCLIMIYDPTTNGSTWWMANSEAPSDPIGLYIKYHEHTTYLAYIKAWKERDLKWQYILEGTVKKEWDDFLFVETELSHLPDFVIEGMKSPDRVYLNSSFNSFGNLTLATLEPLSKEHFDILLRFAKVFDLTYTRFNDLLKAEAQAREGQIQLAMERVRARTMAMQHSDELKNAAALLFQQVKSLGAPAYSCGYNIWEKDEKEFTSWMSTQDGSEINGVPNIPLIEDANFIRYEESKQNGEPFFVLELRGERMQEHYNYLKTIPAFKAYFEYAISVGFDLPETQIHHLANFSQGNLLFITLEPCPEFHDVFKRFAAVFEQTYTRFLDLQKAEAQAREAEIELGLERVRARGMAMQKSDELAQLVDTVFKELTKLHILLDRCIIRIEDPKTNGSTWWLANPETGSVPLGLFVKYNEYPLNLDYIKAWKARTLKWEYILEGTNKKEYDSFAFSETELSRLPVSVIAGMRSYDRIFLNVSFNNFGSLTVSSAEPLPKEQFDVLLRFAKVFESTYTRFNDLKQVEAQAREAQIELALERVRARTMAMQRSDELREAVLVIYEQLQQLNFDSKACNIIIVDKETGSAQYWVSGFSQEIFPESYTVPYLNHPYQDMLLNPWKQGDTYVVYEYTGKMKQSFDEIFFTQTEFRNVPEEAKKVMIGLESVMLSTAFISYGALQSLGAEPLSEEKANILKRFAKVFEQTYTRFLDLQKAEAQAREAEIELSLERIRSKAMAMHGSGDILATTTTAFEELQKLGIHSIRCGIGLLTKNSMDAQVYASTTDSNGVFQTLVGIRDMNDHPSLTRQYQSWLKQENFVEALHDEELKSYYNKLFFQSSATTTIPQSFDKKQYGYYFSFADGLFYSWSDQPYSENEINILVRFNAIVALTFRRFLDLQKAEEQARESHIQLALERVRARMMAMQRSDELAEAARLLYEEFRTLNINTFLCGYCFYKEEQDKQTVWVTLPDGTLIPDFVDFPIKGDHVLNARYKDWKKKKPLHVLELKGEENREHHRFLSYKVSDQNVKKIWAQIPDRIITYCANFSTGYLFIIASEFLTAEEENIIIRFAKVFELTYTRFSDLKQAELQARESQIQLALERVRARTMAMQRSDELAEVAKLLFQQVKELGITAWTTGFNIWQEDNASYIDWVTDPNGEFLEPYTIDLTRHPVFTMIMEARKRRDDFFVSFIEGEQIVETYQLLSSFADKGQFQKILDSGFQFPTHQLNHFVFGAQVSLMFITYEPCPESWDIFKRFGKVFEQTYTRFLDLQNAEAQAREAQIQLALERVRARTMAMQKSDELTDVAGLLFEQVSALGIKTWTAGFNVWSKDNNSYVDYITSPNGGFIEPYTVHTETAEALRDISDARKSGVEFDVQYVEGEKIKQLYLALTRLDEKQYEIMLQDGVRFPTHQYEHFVFGSKVSLMFITYEPVPEAHDIFKRLGKVFEQTYTRFLDLQKAEAQARESQIQLALERVRARTMAMQKSDELAEVSSILFHQLDSIGVKSYSSGFTIWDNERDEFISWMCNADGSMNPPFRMPVAGDAWHVRQYESWKNGEDFIQKEIAGEEMQSYFRYLRSFPLLNEAFEKSIVAGHPMPERQVHNIANFANGNLMFITLEPCPEAHDIFKRFTKVFEQTYTRFLDLQKAEAQAREARIEAALEKIRSRSLGMHRSVEIKDVVAILFEKLKELDLVFDGGAAIHLFTEGSRDAVIWVASPLAEPSCVNLPYEENAFQNNPIIIDVWHAKETGEHIYNKFYSFEEKNRYFDYVFKHNDFIAVPKSVREFIPQADSYTASFIAEKNSLLGANSWTRQLFSESDFDILKRIARVFEQAYIRFLDLQKAETQAREARIEAALEKVRSRSMAMHRSEELRDVVKVVFDKLQELNFVLDDGAVSILIFKDGSNDHTQWIADPDHLYATSFDIAYTDHSISADVINVKKSGVDYFSKTYPTEEKNEYFKYLFAHTDYKHLPGEVKNLILGSEQYGLSVAFAKNSAIVIPTNSGKLLADDEREILKRFVKVFDQAYTRFLDLLKAEAQAREAKIEAALEKVRSRTMAMQRSDELANVATVLFQQVKALGVPQWTCGFSIFEIDDKEFTWYPGSADGDILPPVKIPLTEHPVFISFNDSRKRGDELFVYEKEGEFQAGHYRYMQSLPGVGEMLQKMLDAGLSFPTFQIDHLANFSHGSLVFITYQPVPEMHDVFKRFAKVFEQTYTRFLDLQRAEAQALEAIKRASVDRVRAEIASMRTTNDLERITPLIWNELTTLGVPFIRCGVFIMDEEKQLVETHLSTPDGKAIATFTSTFSGTKLIIEVLPYWRRKEIYKAHWDEAAFLEQVKSLVQQGSITSGEKYLTENRPTDLYLHFLPFLQGMLYVGNSTPLSDDELQLVQNLADAFSTAYARYEDFNKLESAKEQIEKTLVDLKQAQAQLVQSAKMASLGELTAGIAHEIQNPLNFVNNFSEVNKELLVEMKEEMSKGNIDDANDIANDVIANEEKINHHGKRADAIVKGMLQHSRSSNATKEPTDINTLADEYLRLAYHGLRAKDKSFNATLKTNFDGTVGNINVIAQDIGRVILNLITNAFYATNEKSKQRIEKYEPTVVVSTKKADDNVLISVKDNGNGIPQKVVDKIFQPFFTTKPTGQGTGLGLSLAYDIIKTHGGEIKVESKEGEGAEFIIQLPVV